MSYQLSQLTVCPNIQDQLNAFFPTCEPMEYMPILEWVMSQTNTRNLRRSVNPGGGKVRTVTVTYTPRPLESSITEGVANPSCTNSNFIGDRYTNYTIDTDDNVGGGFAMTPEFLAYSCQSNANYFIERLMDLIGAVERKVASKISPDIAVLMGNWASNVETTGGHLVLNTLKADGTFNGELMPDLDLAMTKTGYCPERIIFGGTTLFRWFRTVIAGCCSREGINVGDLFREYGVAFAYDRRFESDYGINEGIAVAAGAMQLLTYNRSDWMVGMPSNYVDMGSEISVTIVSPRTGLPMDLTVAYNCGKISVNLVATTKLVGMPADMFYQGDFMEGVTYVAPIVVQNPA